MNSWIPKLRSWLSPPPPRVSIPQAVSHHDLEQLFQEVNEVYFDGLLKLKVSWYGRGSTRSRTSIRLGYYNPRTEHIAVSRLLNTPKTPKYFLSYVIYHEVLHHLYPPIQGISGRRKIHHRDFLKKEREFAEYEQAQVFLSSFKKIYFSQNPFW